MLPLAYEGLVAYRHTGGATYGPLVGNLATDVPPPSADGRVYVFRMRQGVRFSDGTLVEPEDFRASLEQVVRRHGRELQPFFDAIIGAPGCVRRPSACDLSRGIVDDPRSRTIVVRLRRPDPDLLHKLASPLAFVAPAEHPFGGGAPPPGTGPYRLTRFDPKRAVEFSRNRHFRVWSDDARPDGLADEIRIRVTDDIAAEVGAVERGELDVVPVANPTGPSIARAQIQELAGRYPTRLHTSPTPSLDFMWLNVRTPPLDDVRVRHALNYAVDRRAVAELEGGPSLARPACQFVPAGYPGYAPACRYTHDPRPTRNWSAPDMQRARALIRRSGTAGQRVTVWAPPDKRGIGRYFAALLGRLGYESRLRVLEDYFPYVADSRHGAQIGVVAWVADFPTPASFTTPFTCALYQPRSPENANLSGFCDRDVERRIDAALATRGPSEDAAWQATYDRLAQAAPGVPLVNRRNAAFVSRRAGNYQYHPFFGVLLDQLWVR